jgi:hypothetical protein
MSYVSAQRKCLLPTWIRPWNHSFRLLLGPFASDPLPQLEGHVLAFSVALPAQSGGVGRWCPCSSVGLYLRPVWSSKPCLLFRRDGALGYAHRGISFRLRSHALRQSPVVWLYKEDQWGGEDGASLFLTGLPSRLCRWLIDWLIDCNIGDWTGVSCMLGKCSTTEIHP